MSLTESFLVVLVLLLTMYIVFYKTKNVSNEGFKPQHIVLPSQQLKTVKKQHPYSPEESALHNNSEYFTTIHSNDYITSDVANSATRNMNGSSYSDFILNQAVDSATLANHALFVADNVGDNTKNAMGRAYALGDLEGADMQPWQGIRGRPQHIPTSAMIGSSQIPDINLNSYSTKKFNW